MLIDGSRLRKPVVDSYDAVIIGSGAGGAPMAYRLAQAGKRVAIIEEGKKHTVEAFNRNAYDMTRDMYMGMATTVTLGNPAVPLPLGRTYGGTTTINSGTCFRTPPHVLAKWRYDYGLAGLTEKSMEPFFDEVEKTIGVEEVSFDQMGAGNRLFAEGAKKLGYSGGPLKRNQIDCKGAGVCAFGCPNDAKRPMHLNYLPLAEKEGAVAFLSARAERILTAGGKAVGVTGSFSNAEGRQRVGFSLRAKVIVLACGTIGTPHLLLKNRLANSSGHVGKHLRIHPAAKVVGFMDHDVESWKGIPQSYYCDELADQGLMFEGFFVPPSMLAMALPAHGTKLKEMMADYNRMVAFGVMVSDTSSGRVRALPFSRDPLMTYNLNRQDTASFVHGVRLAARVYFEMGAQRILPPIFGVEEIASPDDIDRLLDPAKVKPTDLELVAFHPMGTCRMGAKPNRSVVGENLETHDLDNLFIADGSIFPTSLGVNPQESIMAFSEMAARRILDREDLYFR